MPPQPVHSSVHRRSIEAGDPKYLTDHGYAHVIADVRGIGNGDRDTVLSYAHLCDCAGVVEWLIDHHPECTDVPNAPEAHDAALATLRERKPHLFVRGC